TNRDCIRASGSSRNQECRWSDRRICSVAENVERTGLNSARNLCQPLIPIGVQLNTPLLHDHAGEVLPRVESDTAVIEAHEKLLSKSVLVNQPKFQIHRHILLQPNQN